jgi:uncharacterized protein DUF4192
MTGSSGQPPGDVTAVTGPDPDTNTSPTIRITPPEGLIGMVPYLLGFQPGQDIVIIGTRAPHHTVGITLRYPLDPAAVTGQVRHALAVLAMQNYDTAAAVGYGPDGLVTPFMECLRPEAEQHGIRFAELLRVDAGQQRYWSYLCADPDCCPPEGRPYDSRPDPALASSLPADVPTVLDSRKALVELAGPVVGEEAAMIQATRDAEQRLADIVSQAARTGRQAAGRRAVALAGIEATKHAIHTYRQGDRYTHDEGAWLSVCLRDLWVRDDAWSRMDPAEWKSHLQLWLGLTRLALPGYLPAPASLLAFVAWQSGNGALANVALDRALADDPHYSMALLLRQVIDSGAPPSMARVSITPEEVAERYAGHYRASTSGWLT